MEHSRFGYVLLSVLLTVCHGGAADVAAESGAPVTGKPASSSGALTDGVLLMQALAYLGLILFCFVALAVVCDEYLAPALEEFVGQYKIPHDVASATFLAFGSSAPEISINCVATVHGKVTMSLGAVLGSGIIAYTVIPAACVLVSKGQVLHLEIIPLVRDVSFYILAIAMFVFFTHRGEFGVFENSLLLGTFVVYLIALFLLGKFYHDPRDDLDANTEDDDLEQMIDEGTNLLEQQKHQHSHNNNHHHQHEAPPTYGAHHLYDTPRESEEDAIEEFKKERGKLSRYATTPEGANMVAQYGSIDDPLALAGQNELEEAESCVGSIIDCIAAPLRFIFRLTIPPCCPVPLEGEDENELDLSYYWPFTMLVSLVYVSLFSEAVLVFTTGFSEVVGLPHSISGLTILALGAQVPDLFASVAVAKQGEGPSSIANAVGSQIINILVGIGAPFLIYNLRTHHPIHPSAGSGKDADQGLALIGVILFLLVLVFGGLCLRHIHKHGPLNKPALTSLDAVLLASLYVMTLVIIVSSELIQNRS